MADSKDKPSRTPATAADPTADPAATPAAPAEKLSRLRRRIRGEDPAPLGEGEKGGQTDEGKDEGKDERAAASPLLVDQAAPGVGEALVAEAAAAVKRRPRKAGEEKGEKGKVERRRRPKPVASPAVAPTVDGKGIGEALVADAVAPEPRRRGRPRKAPGEKQPRRRYQPGRQRVPPGYLVTGVRVDERLSPMLLALARANGQDGGRSASLTSIACAAMRTFAGLNGVELSEVEISPSRRDDEVLGDRASRRLWVKYPEGWKAGLDELMQRNPALNHTADLWRSALVEFARASGVAA